MLPDNFPGTLGPPVLEQTHEVGVHAVLEVVVCVGGYLCAGVAARQELLPVTEMDCPEAVIAADFTKHLVVRSLDTKEGIVEEDSLERVGVHHPSEVDPGQVVLTGGLHLGLRDVHVVQVAGQRVDDGDQDGRGVDQVHIPSDQVPEVK